MHVVGGLNVFGGFLHHLVFGRAGRKSHPFIRSLQCRAFMPSDRSDLSYGWEPPGVQAEANTSGDHRDVDGVPQS
jgi:hypothetical protein